jgi:hypothetical protein
MASFYAKGKKTAPVICYFIVLLIGSTCLGDYYCPSSGARDYDVDYHIGRVVLGLLLCWRLGAVWLEWCPGCLAQARA